MTTKAWSDLPNAKHIDWVLDTLEKDLEMWDAARDSAEKAALDDKWEAACDAAWDAAAALDAVSDAMSDATCDAVWDDVWEAAWGAVAALAAWDNSAELLDKSAEEVTELARTGNQAAVLLLPAVIVKHKLKEKNT